MKRPEFSKDIVESLILPCFRSAALTLDILLFEDKFPNCLSQFVSWFLLLSAKSILIDTSIYFIQILELNKIIHVNELA